MSRENVEIVKANIDAFNREDWDAAFQEAAPDFELDMSRAVGLERGIYGLDQARRNWEEFAASWESFRVEPHEFIEVGDHVVVPGTGHMVGRDGIEVETRVTFVWTIRNGSNRAGFHVPRAAGCARRSGAVGARRSRRLLSLRDTARAMSQENVETVRANFEVWNADDMDAVRELYDPNVIVRPPEGWPEPGPFVGREAVMRQWEQLRQTWDVDAVEMITDFLDAGDRVAVRVCWHGAGSGPEANLEMTDVFTVRKGKIFYLECFWDHAEALEALGLSE